MSAMSASSGLMPLSLISEHKAAQGGPSPVQQLAFAPEKHSLVQAPKPTPNGMEPSPPLVPVVPPSQPEPQPNLPCGGVSETAGEEERSGGVVPEVEPVEPLPPEVPVLADQPPATEPAPPSVMAPSSTGGVAAAAPLPQAPAEPLVSTDPPAPVSLEPPSQEELAASLPEPQPAPALPEPQPEPQVHQEPATEPPAPSPAQVEPQPKPQTEEAPPPSNEQSEEPKPSSSQPKPEQVAVAPTPPATPAPVGRPSKRTKAASASSTSEKKAATPAATPSADTENGDDKRAKRKRLPTQVYQSPIPEENIIAKINKIDKTPSVDDKLIVFYRNEFIAVRNAEGGFYVCQAMQNVYKTSSKIRIRWLSQEENTDLYSPDFYDATEFDCILTNLNLERIEKNKYRLPDVESQRTQSILKRAIDVEKGVAPAEDSTVTEEHPDGLDLSLYRNEDQLKKRKKSNKSKTGKRKTKKVSAEGIKKGTREIPKRNKVSEVKKVNSVAQSQLKRVGRIAKVAKPVVQRIVAAKKMGRRKAGASSSPTSTSKASPPAAPPKEVPKKKEIPRAAAVKRKSVEPQPATPVPEKKQKTMGSSKTRNQ